MSKNEIVSMIETMNNYDELASKAKAKADAIRDALKEEMLRLDTEELNAGAYIVRYRFASRLRIFRNSLIATVYLFRGSSSPATIRACAGNSGLSFSQLPEASMLHEASTMFSSINRNDPLSKALCKVSKPWQILPFYPFPIIRYRMIGQPIVFNLPKPVSVVFRFQMVRHDTQRLFRREHFNLCLHPVRAGHLEGFSLVRLYL